MTQEQLRKIRNAGYKYWDNEVFENHSDWSKRDVSQLSFEAGAKYALANKYDELKEEQNNEKPNIVQFLKYRGVYEMFMNNLFIQKTHEYIHRFMSQYFNGIDSIQAAFLWSDTPEKEDFWAEINNMWIKRF